MSKRGRVRTKQSTTLIENTLSDNGIHIYNFLEDSGIMYEEFYNKLYEYIDYDIKMIKDCTEKSIVESYVKSIEKFFINDQKKRLNLEEILNT